MPALVGQDGKDVTLLQSDKALKEDKLAACAPLTRPGPKWRRSSSIAA